MAAIIVREMEIHAWEEMVLLAGDLKAGPRCDGGNFIADSIVCVSGATAVQEAKEVDPKRIKGATTLAYSVSGHS